MEKESMNVLIYYLRWIRRPNLFKLGIMCSLLSACSMNDDFSETSMEDNVNALLSTRSIITVTVCTDSYVEVGGGASGGGYLEYKETRCKTCTFNNTPNLKPGEYIAGGFPEYGTAVDYGSGGGGSSGGRKFYVGDNWVFKFDKLNDIYGPSSSLNLSQKGRLENVFQLFKNQPTDFRNVYNKLIAKLREKNVYITFSINPSIKDPARYLSDKQAIEFQSENNINWEWLIEEIVHAVQYNVYYGNQMTNTVRNYEFEAKVFRDLVYNTAAYYEILASVPPMVIPVTDDRPNFFKTYTDWIYARAEKGYVPSSEYNTYYSLCQEWRGYPGTYVPYLVPKMIEDAFRKPRPPRPPIWP